jgi:predicted transcriptional regulator
MSQHELKTLLEIKDDPSLSQRSLAHKLNISLGLTNSILQNLIHRGLIKAKKMTGRKILYLITPKGMVQATNFIYDRVRETQHYYQYTKDLLTTHFTNLYDKGVRKAVIYGTGQLAEITYLSLLDSPLKLHFILIDDPVSSKKKFLGHEVLTLSDFAQKISQTPAPENLIILSTVSQEKDEKGKDKTQSLKTEIKKYKNLPKNIQIINLESILKNVKG